MIERIILRIGVRESEKNISFRGGVKGIESSVFFSAQNSEILWFIYIYGPLAQIISGPIITDLQQSSLSAGTN